MCHLSKKRNVLLLRIINTFITTTCLGLEPKERPMVMIRELLKAMKMPMNGYIYLGAKL
jgi:hypothetical protein